MRGHLVAGAFGLAAALAVFPPEGTEPAAVPSHAAPGDSSVAAALLAAHNRERAARGYDPLSVSPRLQRAAQDHANHMATVGRMAHSGIGDGSPFDRFKAAGYAFRKAGENVAWNQGDVAEVMAAWMHSPGHRWNVLGDYTEYGGAVARGKNGDPYWCTVFGTPSDPEAELMPAGVWYFEGGGAHAEQVGPGADGAGDWGSPVLTPDQIEGRARPWGGDGPRAFLGLLNRERESLGLAALEWDDGLAEWAARNLAAKKSRPGGAHLVTPPGADQVDSTMPSYVASLDGWLHSPGHRRALLNPSYRRVGAASAPDPEPRKWVGGCTANLR